LLELASSNFTKGMERCFLTSKRNERNELARTCIIELHKRDGEMLSNVNLHFVSAIWELYRWRHKDYKGDVEDRREVQLFKPPKEMADYDPNAVPIEWRSWLNGNRRVPPSPEESAR
jgi:hypothetical protein